jgi:Mycothiol maleylpyruvate isomerase N-terminal domain
MSFRDTYLAAADTFADLVVRMPTDGWDEPGLGEWTRRELVGHTASSALRQVPLVLANPAGHQEIVTPEGYWAFARSAPPEHVAAAVMASSVDARKTGDALGDDPADEIWHLVGAAAAALATVGDGDLVETPAGGMRVADWIPTRTFELAVHGMDVAASAGIPFLPPAGVLAECAALAARVAVAVGDGPMLLRALTGRAGLPDHFSVV